MSTVYMATTQSLIVPFAIAYVALVAITVALIGVSSLYKSRYRKKNNKEKKILKKK